MSEEPVTSVPELVQPAPRPLRYKKDGSVDRRSYTSARNLGGLAGAPAKGLLGAEKAIPAVVDIVQGAAMKPTLAKYDLPPGAADKIRKLVDLTPEEYFNRVGDRLENVIEIFTKRLEKEAHLIKPRDLTLQAAILIDKLTGLRGQKAPTSVHNVQVNINGYSRESALAALSGKRIPPAIPKTATVIEAQVESTPQH